VHSSHSEQWYIGMDMAEIGKKDWHNYQLMAEEIKRTGKIVHTVKCILTKAWKSMLNKKYLENASSRSPSLALPWQHSHGS
jgi:hypothetical protein